MKQVGDAQWGRTLGMYSLSRLILVVALVTMLLPVHVARAQTPQPIVGDWQWGDGVIRVTATGSNTYVGTVLNTGSVEALECFGVGAVVWNLSGSGFSYSGTTNWASTADCSSLGQGASTWTLASETQGQYCTTDPTGVRGTICFTITKIIPSPPPQTPQEAILALQAEVDDLVARRILNKGQGNALNSKLSAAFASLELLDRSTAVSQLTAFQNQVRAFVKAGILTESIGIDLRFDAQNIINQIVNS